jgi:hypothetical protein
LVVGSVGAAGCGVAWDANPGEVAVHAVEMDGKLVGSVTGFAVGDTSPSTGQPRAVAFRVDTLSGPELLRWVRDELNAHGDDVRESANRHDVAVVKLDPAGLELGRVALGLAHVEEIVVPKVHADGRDDLVMDVRLHGERLVESEALRAPTADSVLVSGARQGLAGQDRTRGGLLPGARFSLGVGLPGGATAWTCSSASDPVCATLTFSIHRQRQPVTPEKMHAPGAMAGDWAPGKVEVQRDWTGDTTWVTWADDGVEAPRRTVRLVFRDQGENEKLTLTLADSYLLAWTGPPPRDRGAVNVRESATLVFHDLRWE